MTSKRIGVNALCQQAENSAHRLFTTGRKAIYMSLGIAGLAVDSAKYVWTTGADFIERVERRGEKVEADAGRRLRTIRDQISAEAEQARSRMDERIRDLKDSAQRSRTRTETVEQPTNAQPVAIAVPGDEQSEPIPGYDALNAQEATERLSTLDTTGLHMIRAYEVAHKNRITVLRAIDARLDTGA